MRSTPYESGYESRTVPKRQPCSKGTSFRALSKVPCVGELTSRTRCLSTFSLPTKVDLRVRHVTRRKFCERFKIPETGALEPSVEEICLHVRSRPQFFPFRNC